MLNLELIAPGKWTLHAFQQCRACYRYTMPTDPNPAFARRTAIVADSARILFAATPGFWVVESQVARERVLLVRTPLRLLVSAHIATIVQMMGRCISC